MPTGGDELVRAQDAARLPLDVHVTEPSRRARMKDDLVPRNLKITPNVPPDFYTRTRHSNPRGFEGGPDQELHRGDGDRAEDQHLDSVMCAAKGYQQVEPAVGEDSTHDYGGTGNRELENGVGSLRANPDAALGIHDSRLDAAQISYPAGSNGPIPPMAGVYARVSTSDQSTSTQVAALLAEAARLGFIVPADRIHVDDSVSGSRNDRLAFDRLKTAVHTKEVWAVLVTKLDRLGRSA